jgi:integrase
VTTHIEPAFGRWRLNQVTNAEVRAWVSELSTRRSAATTRKAHNALHQMFRAAVSDRRIPFDPTADVPLPTEHAAEQRFLTTGQVETLADSIDPRFRALVLLAAYGGLRFGELAALRRRRVDILRGRVEVAEATSDVHGHPLSFKPPKTKRSRRTVPLPRRVLSELEHHLATYAGLDADALVFTGPKGAPIRRAGFGRLWWRPATKAAGLEGLKFHELRHTFVALSVAAGCDPRKVSIRAGHSSVAFTLDRYGHLYTDDESAEMDRFNTLLSRARPVESASVALMN